MAPDSLGRTPSYAERMTASPLEERSPEPMTFQEFGTTPLGIVLSILAMTVAAATWWFHVGPVRWLVQLQYRVFGSYQLLLTVIVTGLSIFLAMYWVHRLMRRIVLPALAGPDSTMSPWRQRVQQVSWESTSSWAGLTAMALIASFAFEYQVARTSRWSVLSAAEIEAGATPATGLLQTSGYPVKSMTVGYTIGGSRYVVAPVTATTGVEPHHISMLAIARERSADARFSEYAGVEPMNLSGVIPLGGLPLIVKTIYEDNSITFDANLVVLQLGSSRASDLQRWLAHASVVAALGLLVVTLIDARRTWRVGYGYMRVR